MKSCSTLVGCPGQRRSCSRQDWLNPDCGCASTMCFAIHSLRASGLLVTRAKSVSSAMAALVRSPLAGSDPGGKYDATQFVRKAVKQYAAETGCRTRRWIDQEPNRGRAGSARHVCRRDRDRQLLPKQQAGSGAATRSTHGSSLGRPRLQPRPRHPAPVVAKAKRSTGRRLFPTSTGSTDSHSTFRETTS